ncbi:DMT family transporter [Streptomyces sp. NPDC008121]|uniref:DMT family transporter n=1 Tax=Streptomyces sp. NPDC008121 TaxID=3364809 RepID=UPI0036F09DFF
MTGLDGTVLAVLLSLVSAAGYALAAVAQAQLAATPAPAGGNGGGSLRALLARGQWWWAVGLNAAGALAHVAALHYGPLTLVQPLGALTLVAALPLGAHLARRRVTRTEWRGAFWTLAGLVGLVSVTGPATPGEALSLREALVVSAATAAVIAVLASGRRHGKTRGGHPGSGGAVTPARGSGLGHATASGIASGVASALTQTLTAALALQLPGGSLTWWQTALVAVLISGFAVGGLLLSQTAYRGGLAAPLAVVNLANPAAAAVIGVALLGETFRAGGWGWLIAATASMVAARGVVLLTTGADTTPGAATSARAEGPAMQAPASPQVTPDAMPAPATPQAAPDTVPVQATPPAAPVAARSDRRPPWKDSAGPAPRRTPDSTPTLAPVAPALSVVLATPPGLTPADKERPVPPRRTDGSPVPAAAPLAG